MRLFHSCVYYIGGTGKEATVKLYTRCTGHVVEKIFDLAMDSEMDTDQPIDQHPPNDQQILIKKLTSLIKVNKERFFSILYSSCAVTETMFPYVTQHVGSYY